jgi:hypothetical protein
MMVDLRDAWSVRLRAFSRIVHLKASLSRSAKMSEFTTNDHVAEHSDQEDEILDGRAYLHTINRYTLTVFQY